MALAPNQPDARPAWQVTYLDFSVVLHDEKLIEKAQSGDVVAQCQIVGKLQEVPRNHLVDANGRPDPSALFRKGLTIRRVA